MHKHKYNYIESWSSEHYHCLSASILCSSSFPCLKSNQCRVPLATLAIRHVSCWFQICTCVHDATINDVSQQAGRTCIIWCYVIVACLFTRHSNCVGVSNNGIWDGLLGLVSFPHYVFKMCVLALRGWIIEGTKHLIVIQSYGPCGARFNNYHLYIPSISSYIGWVRETGLRPVFWRENKSWIERE